MSVLERELIKLTTQEGRSNDFSIWEMETRLLNPMTGVRGAVKAFNAPSILDLHNVKILSNRYKGGAALGWSRHVTEIHSITPL